MRSEMDSSTDPCVFCRMLCTSQRFDSDFQELVKRLVSCGRGTFVINTVGEFAKSNALAKSDVLLSVLGFCVTLHEGILRKEVYSLVPRICRIPTDLFKFLTAEASVSLNKKGSFGRSKRKLVAQWYNVEVKSAKQLAVLLTKYKRRMGWSHADVLKLAHVKPADDVRGLCFKYALKGFSELKKDFKLETIKKDFQNEAEDIMKYLEGVEIVRHSENEQEVVNHIRLHDLLHEHIPTWMKNSKLVWKALVENMPVLATIKSLNKLTTLGLLDSSDPENCIDLVKSRLKDSELLRQAKIHPFTILIALKTYESGQGDRGGLKWKPNPQINEALNEAFNLSLKTIVPTKKRYLLAVDCCASMNIGGVMNVPSVSPLLASAAMVMAFSKNEPSADVVLLSSGVQPVQIPPTSTIRDIHNILSKNCQGSAVVDCSCPITWAREKEKPVDVFVVYTCQNGQGGSTTPIQAMKEYRKSMKLPHARLVIVTLTSDVKRLDPNDFDMGTLFLSGFDASVHEIIRSFVLGMLDASPGG